LLQSRVSGCSKCLEGRRNCGSFDFGRKLVRGVAKGAVGGSNCFNFSGKGA